MRVERTHVQIEAAKAGNLDEITRVFYDCWTISYAGVLPPELIEKFDYPSAQALWHRVLREAAPGELLVARRDNGDVLGLVRWAPPVPSEPIAGAVHSLYVSPTAQGLGVGSTMLQRACADALAVGAQLVRLWVFRDNAPSREFYSRQGFLPDGVTRTQEEFGQPEIRLVKRLTEALT